MSTSRSTAKKPTRQGVLEMLRRACIVLLCIALWGAAIGFGVLNAKPYSAYFLGFGLSPLVAHLGAWGAWGAFQMIQVYPSFVYNFGGADYRFVSNLRNIAFFVEAVIQTAIWFPQGGLFSVPIIDLAKAAITIAGTVLMAAIAMGLTLKYTAMWGAGSPLHGRTVNTEAREVA